MKIAIDCRQWLRLYVDRSPWIMNTRIARRILRVGQGPHEFMHRLLLAQTTEIHFTPLVSTADAVLFVVDAPPQAVQKAKEKEIPIIIRLDGVGIDAQRLSETERETIRSRIAASIRDASGIVFQSEFSKMSFEKIYGPFSCQTTVIHNGFTTKHIRVETAPPDRHNAPLIVAGRNVPRKRIMDTVRRFIASPYNEHEKLDVVGDIPVAHRVLHPRVHYCGRLTPTQLFIKLKSAKGLLHIDWYDWCPNVVTEAISAGVPVLCGSIGGTKELVQNSGMIADFGDPEPDFRCVDINTPSIRQDLFDHNLGKFLEDFGGKSSATRSDLDMSIIAKRYSNFISKCIRQANSR